MIDQVALSRMDLTLSENSAHGVRYRTEDLSAAILDIGVGTNSLIRLLFMVEDELVDTVRGDLTNWKSWML